MKNNKDIFKEINNNNKDNNNNNNDDNSNKNENNNSINLNYDISRNINISCASNQKELYIKKSNDIVNIDRTLQNTSAPTDGGDMHTAVGDTSKKHRFW